MKTDNMFRRLIILCSLLIGFLSSVDGKDYYVKVNGAGDGSTWSKAMSASKFAQTISSAGDGDVFHLAAGTYYPEIEHEINTYFDTYKSKAYQISSSVSIIGGYSENPQTGDSPDPDKNITTISVDYENDDVIGYTNNRYGG